MELACISNDSPSFFKFLKEIFYPCIRWSPLETPATRTANGNTSFNVRQIWKQCVGLNGQVECASCFCNAGFRKLNFGTLRSMSRSCFAVFLSSAANNKTSSSGPTAKILLHIPKPWQLGCCAKTRPKEGCTVTANLRVSNLSPYWPPLEHGK